MSTRLPVLRERAAASLLRGALDSVQEPRSRPPRALLCVAGADEASLLFARALVRELAARGVAVSCIAPPGASAAASALRAEGAASARELPPGDFVQAARNALEMIPEGQIAIGWGGLLAARFEAWLCVAVGAELPFADLALPAPSAAVASAIGAWLASRPGGRAGSP